MTELRSKHYTPKSRGTDRRDTTIYRMQREMATLKKRMAGYQGRAAQWRRHDIWKLKKALETARSNNKMYRRRLRELGEVWSHGQLMRTHAKEIT